MGDNTGIEWADSTWNPVTGCTKVSPGCDNCYAETLAKRFRGTRGHYFEQGFDVLLRPGRLDQPLRWTSPRRIFVDSMSDLFHDDVPDEYIQRVWEVMWSSPQHTFVILTKRHARMKSLLNRAAFYGPDMPWPLPNVQLGVSAEDQKWADIRIPALLGTPAAGRFVSAEPLLGPIDLDRPRCEVHGRDHAVVDDRRIERCTECAADGGSGELSFGHWLDPLNGGLDWVVVGGESGHHARPMHPRWVRTIRDQCVAEGVAFHFKQWGEWTPERGHRFRDFHQFDGDPDSFVMRVGKKVAGRELDGRTWDELPTPEPLAAL